MILLTFAVIFIKLAEIPLFNETEVELRKTCAISGSKAMARSLSSVTFLFLA